MTNIASSMTAASNGPSQIASQLAQASVMNAQTLLDSRSKDAKAVSTGLSKLQSALQTFSTALKSLSGKVGQSQYTAAFSATGFGTVTASSSAQPGTYSLFVERLASAHQVAFQNLDAAQSAPAGTLAVQLAGGAGFNVNFATADTDADGKLSTTEIARAINLAAGNAGQVNATVVTVNGQSQLVLAAGSTGAAGQITVDTTGLPAGALQTALGAPTELAPAQDAIVWLGAQNTGIKLQQASNTFTAIPGVSMTFTQAQANGSAPLTLTVANDATGMAASVQSFVDAYNALNKALDPLTANASPDGSTPAGTFATDAGVRVLRSNLGNLVRQQMGGLRLMDLGISIDRYGVMSSPDQTKLQKTLAANPSGLSAFFGSTTITTSSGILGSVDKYLQGWLSLTNGQIKQRQDSVAKLQKSIDDRQTRLDNQYTQAYNRYLKQFTLLQSLQEQMSKTTDMFASLSASQSGN